MKISIRKLTQLLSLSIATSLSSGTFAADAKEIFLRLYVGASQIDSGSVSGSTFSTGLDLGFRLSSDFGITGLLLATGQASTLVGETDIRVSTMYFGLAPTYTVAKGNARIDLGLGIGFRNGSTKIDSTTTGDSAFALLPIVKFDYLIGSTFFVNAGLQYLMDFKKARTTVIDGSIGLGFNF